MDTIFIGASHSMASANLNKSVKFMANTNTASKYKPVSYEVNLTSQCSHIEVLLLSKFWSE